MQELQDAYITNNPHPTGENDKLESAGSGKAYDILHAQFHPFFHNLQQQFGYFDVFLFDTEGNLVYSVFKETDFATNKNTGRWKDTDLARVFRGAMELKADERAVFADFAPYGPSFHAPASFIARPVFDKNGDRMGVLAYQMPINELENAMANIKGLGESGNAFMVGSDNLMRSNCRLGDGNDVLRTRVESEPVMRGLAGQSGLIEYRDEAGTDAVAYLAPMKFLGATWVIVTKEIGDIAEAVRTFRVELAEATEHALDGAFIRARRAPGCRGSNGFPSS